uniref:Uncharacterized protein n=1 Tax=Oncorhynchus mykiss TaxID=8022 RepID=A0A8K9XGT5_ONCMY
IEPMPLSYVTLQEQRCVEMVPELGHCLEGTVSAGPFGDAVRVNVCTLFESLNTLQVKDSPPNIFECQLRLWTQEFESWSEEERNSFLHILEERDPIFVAYFYRGVVGTASRD